MNNEVTNSGGPVSSAEPSMEEILASIRRILKDEQTSGTVQPEVPQDEEEEEILVLDSSMEVKPEVTAPETAAEDPITIEPDGMEDVFTAPEPPAFEPDPVPPEAELELPPEEPPAHLTSEPAEPDFPAFEDEPLDLPAFEAEPAPSFSEPMKAFTMDDHIQNEPNDNVQPPHGIIGDNASQAAASSIGSLIRTIHSERAVAIGRPGLTLEDLVREELRPMLKSWLDSNLAPLVERIVRAEIQRVVERTGL